MLLKESELNAKLARLIRENEQIGGDLNGANNLNKALNLRVANLTTEASLLTKKNVRIEEKVQEVESDLAKRETEVVRLKNDLEESVQRELGVSIYM
jgi:chromosome segregation ATPase